MTSYTEHLNVAEPPSIDVLTVWREIVSLLYRVLSRIFRPRSWRGKEICEAIVHIGVESLPIIVVSTAISGIVVTKEVAWHLNLALHTVNMVPGVIGQFILRELGIAIPTLLMAAKVGASITAEIATMKVTEQIDALKLLGIDPVGYLVFPRFIAMIVSIFCLTMISVFITSLCAVAVSVLHYNFSAQEFFNAMRHFITYKDFLCSCVKPLYGAVIPIISCAYGFHCQGGAEGVGIATTQSVVTSTITIIVLDFIVTYLFSLIL